MIVGVVLRSFSAAVGILVGKSSTVGEIRWTGARSHILDDSDCKRYNGRSSTLGVVLAFRVYSQPFAVAPIHNSNIALRLGRHF